MPEKNESKRLIDEVSVHTRYWSGLLVWTCMLLLDTYANAAISIWLYGMPAALVLGTKVTSAVADLVSALAKPIVDRGGVKWR